MVERNEQIEQLEIEIKQIKKQFRQDIRNEASKKAAQWAITGFVGFLSIAAFGWWIFLKPHIINIVGGTPRGAVVSFHRDDLDADTCPPGWRPFKQARARVILGAGDPKEAPGKLRFDGNQVPLKHYIQNQHGGEANVEITKYHLPEHRHEINISTSLEQHPGLGLTLNPTYYTNNVVIVPAADETPMETASEGKGKYLEIMPPFIALYFCKKVPS